MREREIRLHNNNNKQLNGLHCFKAVKLNAHDPSECQFMI